MFGLGGNDILQSSFGNDLLDGGDDNDTLNGKAGDDILKGGNGDDRLVGDKGDDILEGGAGDDLLSGGANNDRLDGGAGDDVVSATGGNNTLIGGQGNDSVSGGFGNDVLIGVDPENGAGQGEQDTLTQSRGRLFTESNLFVLGDENTVFYVGQGNNDFARIRGFDPERDKLQLKGAANQYEAGNTSLNGNRGIEVTFNGDRIAFLEDNTFLSLNDQIFVGDVDEPPQEDDNDPGDPGNTPPPIIIIDKDVVVGTDGDDRLTGDNNNNKMFGLKGDDTLDGRGGNDILTGASSPFGSETNGRGEIDRLRGGSGADTFQLGESSDGRFTIFYDDGNPRTRGTQDIAIIEDFKRGQDTIELIGSADQYVLGRSPLRRLADGRAIFLDTNENGRRDRRDELIGIVEGVNNLQKWDLTFREVPMVIGDGNLRFLRGGKQDGILAGSARSETLAARGGDDVVLGNHGSDLLNGGSGDDLLFGGKGRDDLRGGKGRDRFVIAPQTGRDRILDFQDGIDQIGLADGLTFADLDITQVGDRTVIRLNEGNSGGKRLGILSQVSVDQIGADDFVSITFQPSPFAKDIDLPAIDLGTRLN